MNGLLDTDWFAGFSAGEGCFTCQANHAPRFTIALRIDDLAILEQLQGIFGGCISLRPAYDTKRPQAQWHVTSKRDLLRLVAYFDQHPLRAKKANDYAIWREAVRIYSAKGVGAGRRELAVLHEGLVAVKTYDGEVEIELAPDPQLSLIEGGLP